MEGNGYHERRGAVENDCRERRGVEESELHAAEASDYHAGGEGEATGCHALCADGESDYHEPGEAVAESDCHDEGSGC